MLSDDIELERRRRPAVRRPIIFLDIDGVLNTTRHSTQIHIEKHLVSHLATILHTTDALIVLTTFWRHFHDYITYILHRHGIDVGRHMLPLPMRTTGGKQCTKTFLRYHHSRMMKEEVKSEKPDEEIREDNEQGGDYSKVSRMTTMTMNEDDEDCREYSSRADEIEAWLMKYGNRYLTGAEQFADDNDKEVAKTNNNKTYLGYEFHPTNWKYVILDDRPSAAKMNTPLMDRFVQTNSNTGLTEEDVEQAIGLLSFVP